MGIPTEKYDLLIVGSGPAGYLSALLASRKGASAAIIEKGELGGTCLNRGCIPTKTLLDEALQWNQRSVNGSIGNRAEKTPQVESIFDRKNAAVSQVVSGLRRILNRDRITVVPGEASFTAPHTLSIKKDGKVIKILESERILLANGAVPAEALPLKTDGKWIIGSDEALRRTDLPASLAIVGGGRRGVEFASFFSTLGVPVTLIEKQNRILPRMDREISVRYRGLYTKRGIRIMTDVQIASAELSGKGDAIALTLLRQGKEEKLDFQRVLVVGERRGNADGLDLEKASLRLEKGFIPVDSRMKTSGPGISAAGDIVGKGFLAHQAFLEAKVAVRNLFGENSEMEYRFVPICVYASPESASVGLTEEEAKEKWGEIKVGKFPFVGCGRAVAASEQEGMVKIIAEKKYGEILGVHILGPRATELIHLAAMAMKYEIGANDLREMVFAHPTFSEAFWEAALDLNDEAVHLVKG